MMSDSPVLRSESATKVKHWFPSFVHFGSFHTLQDCSTCWKFFDCRHPLSGLLARLI